MPLSGMTVLMGYNAVLCCANEKRLKIKKTKPPLSLNAACPANPKGCTKL